ncbi:undecaprenyldiphospho-muramoylpentapeptide beta-N-acetylglucosaminyltransferase [bacterium]|nr:undecaprenyldiphospho-muramoylpentapeptide beta-N-acetylglucosaminyltransferase [bacterium]
MSIPEQPVVNSPDATCSATGRLFVFAGGGTGGHLTPGIAVADELRRRESDCRIRFVGSGRLIEARMIEPTGYELTAHAAPPLSQLKRHPLHFLTAHWRAVRDARRAFQRDQPAAVIGLGGFASVPIVIAAQRERIPVLLLEQNVIPGRANRWLAKRHPICVTFDETRHYLSKQATCHVTGNPLRTEVADLACQHQGATAGSPGSAFSAEAGTAGQAGSGTQRRTLLILGGSHGSRQINESVLNAVRELREQLAGWQIIHQTGPDGSEEVRRVYSGCGLTATVEPFFDNLPQFYPQTTLAISRAGATTLTELAAVGIPAILIPYPQSAADHQTRNAEVFARAGAAILIDNPARSSEPLDLTKLLCEMLSNPVQLSAMRTATRTLSRADATTVVTDLLLPITR